MIPTTARITTASPITTTPITAPITTASPITTTPITVRITTASPITMTRITAPITTASPTIRLRQNPYQRLPLPTAQITGIRIMMTEAAATATVTTMTAMITTAMMTMMMTTEIPFPCFHIQAGAALSVSACMYERQTRPPQTLL